MTHNNNHSRIKHNETKASFRGLLHHLARKHLAYSTGPEVCKGLVVIPNIMLKHQIRLPFSLRQMTHKHDAQTYFLVVGAPP